LRRLYHIYIIYEAHTCAHGSSRYPYMCAYSEISLHQVKLRRLYVVYISGMQVRHACMQLRVIHIEAPFSWHRHCVCRRHVTKKLASVDSYAGRVGAWSCASGPFFVKLVCTVAGDRAGCTRARDGVERTCPDGSDWKESVHHAFRGGPRASDNVRRGTVERDMPCNGEEICNVYIRAPTVRGKTRRKTERFR
jgi:hypothetical protein